MSSRAALVVALIGPAVVALISEAVTEGAQGITTRFGPAYGYALLAELLATGVTVLLALTIDSSTVPALVGGALGLLAIPAAATGGASGSRAPEPSPRRAEARPPDFDLARPTAGRPVTLGLGFAF